MQLSCIENMSHDYFTINKIKSYSVKGRYEIICINKFINSSNLVLLRKARVDWKSVSLHKTSFPINDSIYTTVVSMYCIPFSIPSPFVTTKPRVWAKGLAYTCKPKVNGI